jgi:hypothetical protein
LANKSFRKSIRKEVRNLKIQQRIKLASFLLQIKVVKAGNPSQFSSTAPRSMVLLKEIEERCLFRKERNSSKAKASIVQRKNAANKGYLLNEMIK